MKKITLTAIITIILISTSTLTVASTEKQNIKASEDETYHLAVTYGPAWMKLFTKIELIDGDEEQINRIEGLLKRQMFKDETEKYVNVEQLTFKVTFRLSTTRFSRFLYRTMFTKINLSEFEAFQDIEDLQGLQDFINNSIDTLKNNTSFKYSRKHSITYENFTGTFVIIPSRLLRVFPQKFFIPTKFMFIGVCENIAEN